MNLSEFSTDMSTRLPSQNMIYAVRMQGTFPHMKVRAIPAQQKPYPTLTDAAKNQSVYTYTDATGTVVGFYTPVFFKGLNVAGYHLHFISDDQHTGGHILDFVVPANTTVEYDITPEFEMLLPTSGAFIGVESLTGSESGTCTGGIIDSCFSSIFSEHFLTSSTHMIGTTPMWRARLPTT